MASVVGSLRRNDCIRLLLVLCLLQCMGCPTPSRKAETPKPSNPSVTSDKLFVFEDVTLKLGIQHTVRNGEESKHFSILESMGSGLASFDFDRDGRDDLFFTGGGDIQNKQLHGVTSSLWRNRQGNFANVTLPAGVPASRFYTQGVSHGDIDNDGFLDFIVSGYGGIQLFKNQGDGTFVEITMNAGIVESNWSTSVAFGDFDNDGNLDVYIVNYVDWSWDNHPLCGTAERPKVCDPGAFGPIAGSVYFSDGQGSFLKSEKDSGLGEVGRGLGIMVADFTQDDQVDVYIANDTTNNHFYENLGKGRFQEIGTLSGTATDSNGLPEGSMGVCTLDFNGDLLPDIWVCNYESQAFALYRNDGSSNFKYYTPSAGLLSLGLSYVAFGTLAADFDLDGDEDIVVSNGHVDQFPENGPCAQEPLVLVNDGKGKLARKVFEKSNYFGKSWRGRGAIHFDFDSDGDLDLAFSHVNQPSAVLENKSETTGHWFMLELIGTKSNRDAIGAKVIFQTNKRKLLRNVVGGGSYLSQSPYRIHVGLPASEKLNSVEVRWPSGVVQNFELPEEDKMYQLIENDASVYVNNSSL